MTEAQAEDIFTIMAFGGVVLIATTGTATIVSLAVRYRRARTASAQLKWLLYAGALIVAALLAEVLVERIMGPGTATGNLQNAVLSGAVALVAVAIGIAVLRYRLYDIDRVISRTVAYTIVTGLLVGVYAGLLLTTPGVPGPYAGRGGRRHAGGGGAVQSVRRRVQKAVDQRFNRARYDADRAVAAFAAHLRRRRPGFGPGRPGRCRAPGPGTRPYRCGSASTTEAGLIGVAASNHRAPAG